VGLTPHPHLVLKVLEKSRAIPLLTLRACMACKKGENLVDSVQHSVQLLLRHRRSVTKGASTST